MQTNSLKRLVIRLSSLGDVVLSSAVLDGRDPCDFLVAEEFAPLLEGHPGIHRLWVFNRRSGLGAWLRLARELRSQKYDLVLDLHSTLRTWILRLSFLASRTGVGSSWRKFPKERLRLYGYFLFKRLWPARLRPRPVLSRHLETARIAAGSRNPDLTHLLSSSGAMKLAFGHSIPQPYICIMPAAAWPGKRWPVNEFAKALQGNPKTLVVLGAAGDEASLELVRVLEQAGLKVFSGVGKWDLKATAQVMSGADLILSNDTGLAHLAESVGVPAHVVFGPTTPEMGFGPWKQSSHAYGSGLWCRPCSKDGSACFRIAGRYRCLSEIDASRVREALLKGQGS